MTAESAGRQATKAPVWESSDQSVIVKTADYSSTSARHALAGLLQRPVFVGEIGGDRGRNLYVSVPGRESLLRITRDGRFHDNARQGVSMEGILSAVFSDYDHSGQQSLFAAGTNGITLYRNDGRNSFADATRKAGLPITPGVLCTSVALGDVDGDGFPDLLAAAYTDLNHPPAKPAFTFPNDFSGVSSRLYRNNGNGAFTDVTESAGLGKNPGRARKAMFADFNADGRLDILLLRDDKPPVLYLNRGGWKFEDATWDAGDALTTHAFFEGAVTDFDRDGKADLALWSTHSFRVLLNQGNASFKLSGAKKMPEPALSVFGFRGLVADLDGNGFDDVVTVDQEGRLRAFANHEGSFREAPLALPQSFSGIDFESIRWHDSPDAYLLAMQRDGRITLLKRQRAQ